MTPAEKASELYIGYWQITNDSRMAKKCALIGVIDILSSNSDFAYSLNIWADDKGYSDSEKYWLEVKKNIENLPQ